MFLERNHNDQGILFEISSNAFQVYSFCKCYTFLENDWLFVLSSNCLKSLELCHYLPKIYPNYLDLSPVLISTAEFVVAIIKYFVDSDIFLTFFDLALTNFPAVFIVFDLDFINYFGFLHYFKI